MTKSSEGCIAWFQSYLSERIFFLIVENELSDYGRILWGFMKGSIQVLLLFLIYVNHISEAVNSNLFLYAEDSCLMFQQRYWGNQKYHGCGVNNRLSIYFGKDKTKLIVLISHHKIKNTKKLNIKYKEIEIK